ncbi:hypothetical protein K438DRAFT_1756763 [Mycena galopus ATCC 62051]|nr:hypothetical protein K438DRAFT_1756763 [Mycena galopus ATCC 62051]
MKEDWRFTYTNFVDAVPHRWSPGSRLSLLDWMVESAQSRGGTVIVQGANDEHYRYKPESEVGEGVAWNEKYWQARPHPRIDEGTAAPKSDPGYVFGECIEFQIFQIGDGKPRLIALPPPQGCNDATALPDSLYEMTTRFPAGHQVPTVPEPRFTAGDVDGPFKK